MATVFKVGRFQYIHVLDENTIVTRLVCGPVNFVRKAHEKVVVAQTQMLEIHPMCFCKIQNPVVRDDKGEPVMTNFGQVKIRHGEQEIRFQRNEPFPLYPGETLATKVGRLKVIKQNQAFLVEATRDFTDDMSSEGTVKREAGDQWLVKGPKTYMERVTIKYVSVVNSIIVKPNQAIRLMALQQLTDCDGVQRCASEEWLVRKVGNYLPQLGEKHIQTVQGQVITQSQALKLRAKTTFTDNYQVSRKAGEEWLVTTAMTEVHILDVHEEFIENVFVTTLTKQQYCVIINPYDTDTKSNLYGTKSLIKGEKTFFLQPGESMQGGVQEIKVLAEDEALLLKAKETMVDDAGEHKAGDKWMIRGPRDYIPTIQVEILESRKSIPLDKKEGIYVKDLDTGAVRSVIGETYLLQENEALWSKEVLPEIEALLHKQSKNKQKRNKTRVITYQIQQNNAVQLYDYKTGVQRIEFGPSLILLSPHEEFTVNSLSGGTPKREGQIKTVSLQLGPDFMTDVINVETSDHAQLSLQLCYNWHFEIDQNNEEEKKKLFCVSDFIGYVCNNIASRVRGSISSVTFEHFQLEHEIIIKKAVFGVNRKENEEDQIRSEVHFKDMNLHVTSVDIKSFKPIDVEVRKNLEKGISLKMDLIDQQMQSDARHKAAQKEQKNKGALICQQLKDQNSNEEAMQDLLKSQAENLKIRLAGESKAKAQAEAEELLIMGRARLDEAKLIVEAEGIKARQKLKSMIAQQKAQVDTLTLKNNLEIQKVTQMTEIEVKKFKSMVEAIGKDTLVSISKAGPEMKAKMLKGLGLKGFLVTDGKNPINLFNTANGMLGNMGQK